MKDVVQTDNVVIKFAGDSGDGMQLVGVQFSLNTAIAIQDLATFPDFPAEIRAPQGTPEGVSGFQLHFGSTEIDTAGDELDVLVAMNAAAFKQNIHLLKQNGLLLINSNGFDSKNLKLAGYSNLESPITDEIRHKYRLLELDAAALTKEALEESTLDAKEKMQCRNVFMLGLLYWLFARDMKSTIDFFNEKFAKQPALRDANLLVLQKGFHYGETIEAADLQPIKLSEAQLEPGQYRSITGNLAVAYGLITAGQRSGLQLFFGSYPITPASDILQELARDKKFGVICFQAEDEIAAAAAALGASFGGKLAACGTSGPGMVLKAETMNLAVMLEQPLVVIDVQRAGPSTGMPTKTEQADLLMAIHGRNGESPLPVLAAATPSDCFDMTLEACRIALEYMTPVILLSDSYLANGAEPWNIPQLNALPAIHPPFAITSEGKTFQPYERNANLVRQWAIPGMKNMEHRIGGLEKEDVSGNISYDGPNHEKMVRIRQRKIEGIAAGIPEQKVVLGAEQGDCLVLGWGSTYGSLRSAVKHLLQEGQSVSLSHLRYLNPMPANLQQLFDGFAQILVPELNNGQLIHLLRAAYRGHFIPYNKIQGMPFTERELYEFIQKNLKANGN